LVLEIVWLILARGTSFSRRNYFIPAGRDVAQKVRDGPEKPPARPDPPWTVGSFRWARVGRGYSHRTFRHSGNAEASRCLLASVVSGARERCERRERARCRQGHQPPVKARNAAEGGARPEHGGGQGGAARRRARRVGTRSGYGSTGGRGFFGGAVAGAARGSGCVADAVGCGAGRYRTLHHAKSTPSEGTDECFSASTSIWGEGGGVR
jgi:hypothetical protein